MKVKVNEYIRIDSDVCHGKPTFKDSRVMVWQVLEMLESGASNDEIKEAFPNLSSEAIKAALHYAVDLTRRDNVVAIPQT